MKKPCSIVALLLLLTMLLCACHGGDPSFDLETDAPTAEQTTPAPDTDTDPGTDTDPDSEEQTTEVTEAPLPENCVFDFDVLEDEKLQKCFSSPNQAKYTVGTDENGEKYISLSTAQAGANDPNVTFDCNKFLKSASLDNLDITEYPYIMLKVRNLSCTNGTFELFYKTKSMAGISGDAYVVADFAPGQSDWQYVLFLIFYSSPRPTPHFHPPPKLSGKEERVTVVSPETGLGGHSV